MSYGDTYVDRVTASVDDEFQERILFQAESVGLRYAYWGMLSTVALMAWVLPGDYLWCSLLPVVPVAVAGLAETRWMKRYAPRPRPLRFVAPEVALFVVFVLVWAAGVVIRGQGAMSIDGDNGAMVSGFLSGAVVGGPAAWLIMRRQRAADEARLEAGLDD